MKLNETTLVNLRGTNPTPIQAIIDSHSDQADRDVVKSLREEDLLDLQMAEMTEDEAEAHVLACDTYLEFNGNPISHPDLTIVEADLILFKDFLVEATKKRNGTERYITAMSITFGAVGDRVIPIFQSVYLKWVRYDAGSQNDLYDAPYTSYGKCYKFDNAAGFVSISQTDKERMLEDYKRGIKIAHKSGEGLQNFRPTVDVESILIPLQTIYTVTCNTVNLVGYITHGVREVQYDNASPRKHIVMASGLQLPFIGNPVVYANRSHLCPPCTASFGFDLA